MEVKSNNSNNNIGESLHNLYLETLRHREQEIFRYLAILGPALAGFIWLLDAFGKDETKTIFIIGTMGVISLLLLGAIYSSALGYNYRYIIILLAKLEVYYGLKDIVLVDWPRNKKAFIEQNKFSQKVPIPWCKPPEIINVFRRAFFGVTIGVTIAACVYKPDVLVIVGGFGLFCLFIECYFPYHFGKKIDKILGKEPEEWMTQSCNSL